MTAAERTYLNDFVREEQGKLLRFIRNRIAEDQQKEEGGAEATAG